MATWRVCLVALALTAAASLVVPAATSPRKPNFVVIMTDDQGDMLDDTARWVMPNLNKYIFDEGQRCVNYFVTTPVCCPSRVNFLRGQMMQNTNYTDVLAPAQGGVAGWDKFKELQVDESYLPSWMQQLGYHTFWTGKFIVDYTVNNYEQVPKGFTDFDALVMPYTFQFYDPVFSRNGNQPRQFFAQYTTDVIAEKALQQIVNGANLTRITGKPFYAHIGVPAPHFSSSGPTSPDSNPNIVPGNTGVPRYPPVPAPRHWNLFNDRQVPKPLLSFNEPNVQDKPSWVRSLPRMSEMNITYLEEIYRLRLRSLAAVDELIGRVFKQLEQEGILDDTYVIFTSDNGYHMGTHRRPAGKLSAYEEDIRVPFGIRGPGIAKGYKELRQAAHIDVAPTMIALAGGLAPPEIDGGPLPLREDNTPGGRRLPSTYPKRNTQPKRAQMGFNFYNGGLGDTDEYFDQNPYPANNNWTWKGVRVHNPDSNPDWSNRDEEEEHAPIESFRQYPLQDAWKYAVICNNERELYNLRSDPYETNNIWNSERNNRLASRIDTVMQMLQTCHGEPCRTPWFYIHNTSRFRDLTPYPTNLWEALNSRFDRVYNDVPRFTFKSCQRYMDFSNENNFYKPIIGTFPRTGANSSALAPVTILFANGTAAPPPPPRPNFNFTDALLEEIGFALNVKLLQRAREYWARFTIADGFWLS